MFIKEGVTINIYMGYNTWANQTAQDNYGLNRPETIFQKRFLLLYEKSNVFNSIVYKFNLLKLNFEIECFIPSICKPDVSYSKYFVRGYMKTLDLPFSFHNLHIC